MKITKNRGLLNAQRIFQPFQNTQRAMKLKKDAGCALEVQERSSGVAKPNEAAKTTIH